MAQKRNLLKFVILVLCFLTLNPSSLRCGTQDINVHKYPNVAYVLTNVASLVDTSLKKWSLIFLKTYSSFH